LRIALVTFKGLKARAEGEIGAQSLWLCKKWYWKFF